MGIIFDVGIIGVGTAGAFSAYKIAQNYTNIKCVIFDTGRAPGKRRFQMSGFLGLLPNSDGKLYLNDIDSLKKICKKKATSSAYSWFQNNTSSTLNNDVIEDTQPYRSTIKKIKNNDFTLTTNDHIQLIPKEIHSLSKHIAAVINANQNITQNFDDEIEDIQYNKKQFIITSSNGTQTVCKKLILGCGRSGWRWSNRIFDDFGLTYQDTPIKFGIRAELPASSIKEYNKSNCMISNDDLEIGPLSWMGQIVPEDHFDTVISSFRSNETRWASDKVSFNIFGNQYVENNVEYLDRMAQLTFILTNERVLKEKINLLLTKKSKISILPEYDWLVDAILKIEKFMPEIVNGSFYTPTLLPIVPKIKLNPKLQTEHKDLICVGETTGYSGLLFAILSGIIAADTVSL